MYARKMNKDKAAKTGLLKKAKKAQEAAPRLDKYQLSGAGRVMTKPDQGTLLWTQRMGKKGLN